MQPQLRALIVEDRPEDAELLERQVRSGGFRVIARRVDTPDTLRLALREFSPTVILSDFSMPAMDGLAALEIARELAPHIPFIFVSGTIGEETAVEALKLGATDYVLKESPARLVPAIRRALRDAEERAALLAMQEALLSSEELFSSFMQHLPGRASTKDGDGRYTFVNEAWQRSMGIDMADAIGRRFSEIVPPDLAEQLHAAHQQVLATNSPVQQVLPAGTGTRQRWWLSNHFPIPDPAGGGRLVGTVGLDITDKKEQEQKLARLSRIHAMLSAVNSLIVRVRDRDELFRGACRIAVEHGGFDVTWIGLYDATQDTIAPAGWAGNEAARLMQAGIAPAGSTGVTRQAIKTKAPVFINDLPQAPDTGSARRRAAVALGCQSLIALPLVVDDVAIGAMTLYSKQRSSFTADELRLLSELAGDISFALSHISVRDRAEYLAFYDPLTGLPNRALFLEYLSRALQAAEHSTGHLVLVLGDIKRFRMINDTLGRHVGDELLRQVAARLRQFAENPSNLARVSSNCFAALLPGIRDLTEVAHRVERAMTLALQAPFSAAGEDLMLAATAGVSVFPGDGKDAETLFRNAEAALAKAKSAGESYLFYEPSINARVAETLQLENRLRRALELDQFVLHYQPKVSLRDSSTTGLEALIRWQHPELGLVSPAKFIPLLEETGLIADVGRWALGRAVADYRNWTAAGARPPRVAVNVSAHQLRQKDFVDSVIEAVEGFGNLGVALDLEITESMIMENIQATTRTLQIVRGLGIDVAVDDFGTGYSSLGYIAKLPVSHLKIDRSFIVEMTRSKYSRDIVTMIISLAHTLGMKVIAEGVDDKAQLQLLLTLGCDEIQGYLISKPLPPGEIASFLLDMPVPARH